jgi:hypothetical protein
VGPAPTTWERVICRPFLDLINMDAPSENVDGVPLKRRARDIGRVRPGVHHKKRLHILLDESCKAFKGWQDQPDPWTYNVCEFYIEWCHISKLWPLHRHNAHRRSDKANLHYCKCPVFTERCIQVSQNVYRALKVPRNVVNLSIARMVYAEVVLQKRVDWRTLPYKPHGNMNTPTTQVIPTTRLFEGDALGKKIHKVEIPDNEVQWSKTSSDDSSTGHSPSTTREILDTTWTGNWLDEVLHEMVANDSRGHNDGAAVNTVDSEVVAPEKPDVLYNSDIPEYSIRFETELEEQLTKELDEHKLQIINLEAQLRERDEIIATLRAR